MQTLITSGSFAKNYKNKISEEQGIWKHKTVLCIRLSVQGWLLKNGSKKEQSICCIYEFGKRAFDTNDLEKMWYVLMYEEEGERRRVLKWLKKLSCQCAFSLFNEWNCEYMKTRVGNVRAGLCTDNVKWKLNTMLCADDTVFTATTEKSLHKLVKELCQQYRFNQCWREEGDDLRKRENVM